MASSRRSSLVRFGVPTFTHSVPTDATALPTASVTASASWSITPPAMPPGMPGDAVRA